MNRRDRERVKTLERRRNHLADRIKSYHGKDPNRDRAELHALNWVLRLAHKADEDGYAAKLYEKGWL